jgi:peptide-methionine (R)-S-oxide reductase
MSRLYTQLWVSIPAAAIFCLICSSAGWAQDPLADAPLAPGSGAVNDGKDKSKTDSTRRSEDSKAHAKSEPEFVVKTDAEWRRILTRAQYSVTRQKATEQPWSGKYATGHFKGMFLCVCCDAPLFSADAKFESGTGWPSFDRPASVRAILTAPDYAELEPRMEVMCRRCRAHLGHVFEDGPTLTGLRYCLNSAALTLKSPDPENNPRTATTRTSSKTKAKAKAKPGAKLAAKSAQSDDSASSADSARPAPADGSNRTSP